MFLLLGTSLALLAALSARPPWSDRDRPATTGPPARRWADFPSTGSSADIRSRVAMPEAAEPKSRSPV